MSGKSARVAVVTGGASGIGAAISRTLAGEGHAVAIFDLNGELAEKTAAEVQNSETKAVGLTVDVTDRTRVDAALEEVRSQLGTPTILVNSAGLSHHGPFLELNLETWNRILAINLTGTFNACQAMIPGMVAEKWGRIVNISSSSVHSGAPRLASYVSAKSAVVGLTKALALEFARDGITVNTVPPGFIDTPMSRRTAAGGHIDIQTQIDRTPVGRQGQPEDIAHVTAFLVSEEASYITGQIIGVNGGRNT